MNILERERKLIAGLERIAALETSLPVYEDWGGDTGKAEDYGAWLGRYEAAQIAREVLTRPIGGMALIELYEVPPSKNDTKGWHWAKRKAEKRRWQDDLIMSFHHVKLPKGGDRRVIASYKVGWPKTGAKHKLPDEANLQAWLDLVVADALTEYGFYPDDGAGRFRAQTPVVAKAPRAYTRIRLEWEE